MSIDILSARGDFSAWLSPLWSGDTVYCETGMFIGKSDRLPLLYTPKKILLVTSYIGDVIYNEGEDFVLCSDGTIALTENSRIPCISEEEYYHDKEAPGSNIKTLYNGKEVFTYWGEGMIMHKWQICVTYTHTGTLGAFIPPCQSSRYADLLAKLERGEDVTLLFFGDSITFGASSSFFTNIPPYAHSWSMLVTEELARRYGYTVRYIKTGLDREVKVPDEDASFGNRGVITYVNTSVGGWSIKHAIEHFEERIAEPIRKYGCDLFAIAFGMNDGGSVPETFMDRLKTVLERTVDFKSDISMLLIATMLPNNEATNGWYRNQPLFEEPMSALADEYNNSGVPCSVAPVTSMSKFICSRKRFRDHTGNNINHPNDFMIRAYAQVALQTLAGIE